jgi:hypothetical protein
MRRLGKTKDRTRKNEVQNERKRFRQKGEE